MQQKPGCGVESAIAREARLIVQAKRTALPGKEDNNEDGRARAGPGEALGRPLMFDDVSGACWATSRLTVEAAYWRCACARFCLARDRSADGETERTPRWGLHPPRPGTSPHHTPGACSIATNTRMASRPCLMHGEAIASWGLRLKRTGTFGVESYMFRTGDERREALRINCSRTKISWRSPGLTVPIATALLFLTSPTDDSLTPKVQPPPQLSS